MSTIRGSVIDIIGSFLFYSALAFFLIQNPARGEISSLKTSYGILESRKSKSDRECGQHAPHPCSVVALRNVIITSNAMAGVVTAFPSVSNPRLIELYSGGGGNLMPPGQFIIHVSPDGYCEVGDFSLENAVSDGDGVLIKKFENFNKLGDEQFGLYSYKYNCAPPRLVRKYIDYDTTIEEKKTRPSQYLSDPVARRPLISAIGEKSFSDFRFRMRVEDRIARVDGRYIVGAGCTPRNCQDSGAIFIIDKKSLDAVAASFERRGLDQKPPVELKLYGNFGPRGGARVKIINEWASENGFQITSHPFN